MRNPGGSTMKRKRKKKKKKTRDTGVTASL